MSAPVVIKERAGVASIADVQPLHVAAYIEQLGRERSTPTVKQRLAAIRHLFRLPAPRIHSPHSTKAM